jgi:hypothetical protein
MSAAAMTPLVATKPSVSARAPARSARVSVRAAAAAPSMVPDMAKRVS